ncbi:MAG: anti-sigma factor domain-containing protein [Candidatus Methylomirabilales bacterium]
MDPTRPSHCDEIPELIPAYALEALTQAEQALVEEHVAGCHGCRTLLADHQALAEGLLYTAPPVAASPHLEADLRRRLSEAKATGAADRPPRPLRAWPEALFSPAARPALAATVLVLLTLAVVSNVYWVGTTNQLRTHQAMMAEQMEHALVDEQLMYDAMRLLATGGHTVVLRGDAPAPEAIAMLALSRDRPEAFLVVDDLPQLPAGKIYQVWLIRDGQRESGGLFDVEPDGENVIVVRSQQPLANYQAVEITVEPAGGSPSPTSPRVMGGRLP